MPELELPRRMWAGVEIEARRPLCVGDRVTRRSRAAPTSRKLGREGPLAFVTIAHDYDVDGALALSEAQTIVYKPPAGNPPAIGASATGNSSATDGPAPGARLIRRICTTPLQLFRFSALTFNAHRIHYDGDFARTVEGYADILVHGTLTAALILDAALAHAGPASSWTASIRARAPARCGPLEIWAADTEGGLALDAMAGSTRVMSASLALETDHPDGEHGACLGGRGCVPGPR